MKKIEIYAVDIFFLASKISLFDKEIVNLFLKPLAMPISNSATHDKIDRRTIQIP
jgi:hypothetical protein